MINVIKSAEELTMDFVHYEVKHRVGYITLTREEKCNALNSEAISNLKQALTAAEEDEACKVVVLRTEGKVFCAGSDLEYLHSLQHYNYYNNLVDSAHVMELLRLIYTFKKVVIAQVQGHAIGTGCGLASICDFVFAVPEARFGYNEVKKGFVPALESVFMIRKIGESNARHLFLTGDLITAEEAQRIGLINYIVPAKELEERVAKFAQKLCVENSKHAMEVTKEMIARVQEMSLEEALQYASEINAMTRGTKECERGILAFLDKETVKW